MLQQDLLDTLFLNRKALADVGGGTTTSQDANQSTTPTTTQHTTNATSSTTSMMKSDASPSSSGAEACPVDHKSREAWLAQARAAQVQEATTAPPAPAPAPPPSSTEPKPASPSSSSSSSSGWGWRIPFLSSSSSASSTTSAPQQQQHQQQQPQAPPQGPPSLGQAREVSTIPRATGPGATSAACPVNHETETGADAATGNWVYPSEKMFFDAMKRKGHDTRAADMRTVVPIHNAVNERAWVEIKQWEAPYTASR